MIFSVTELGTFRRCRRRAVLTSKNGQHLTPMFTPLALNVGTVVHRAHQLWLEQPTVPMTMHAMTASVEMQAKVQQAYTRQVGAAPSDAEMLTTHEAIDIALTMCENYAIKWGTPLPPDYRLISAEQKVRVPVPGCEHILEGKLDGLIQHVSGRVDVLEHKTYGARPRTRTLQMNDQFLAYLWMIKQLGFNTHLDSCVSYDGMWRRAKVPRGRTFDDLFARYTLTRTPDELEEYGRFLPIQLNEMAATYERPEQAYINRPWLGCDDCGVIDLCLAMSRKEDVSGILAAKYTTRTDDLDDDAEDIDAAG